MKIVENVPPPAKDLVRNEPLHSGGQLSGIKDFLKGMRDPQRSAVIRDTAIRLQRDWQRPVAKYIGLTEDDLTQLATLIADQRLQSQVALQSCKLDPTCKTDPQAQTDLETKLQVQIAQLLGPSKAAAYEEYQKTGLERAEVEDFRLRLTGDNDLSTSQSRSLVAAIAEVRQEFLAQAYERGAHIESDSYLLAAIQDESGTEHGQLPESATDFSHRLTARVSAVLTPQQLSAFEGMQDESLENWKQRVERSARLKDSERP